MMGGMKPSACLAAALPHCIPRQLCRPPPVESRRGAISELIDPRAPVIGYYQPLGQPVGAPMGRWGIIAALLLLATGAALPEAWAGDAEDCNGTDALLDTRPAGVAAGVVARVVAACRRLADQGNAVAQCNLGNLYDDGLGVPKDEAESARWLHKAGEQGYAPAQYLLGIAYATGDGVPEDYVQAHLWWSLVAAQGDAEAAQWRVYLAADMTRGQIKKAEALEAAWKPKTAGQ
jgi:hypothetical protein